MHKLILQEFQQCLYSILKEPTAVDVEFYLDKIDELLLALREYVATCNDIARLAEDKYEHPNA